MEQLISQILSTAKGIWKYRWYSMAIAWVTIIVGFGVITTLPDNYQASARVFVDTQSILKPLLAGMTTIPDVEQQVSIMSRTLLSRPNAERVMRMSDLDIKAKSVAEKETALNNLMSQIKIMGTTSNDIYSIAYSNPDPKVAKSVVQSLLTIFIEGSFGDKKQDSSNAIRFIDDQIKQYEAKLVTAENAIKDFKLKNSAIVAGKEGDFGGKLGQSVEQLTQARLELSEAEQARNSIKKEIAGEEPILEGEGAQAAAGTSNPELDGRIEALNKTLDGYRLQYTEAHPDIVATKRLIAQLEARKLREAKTRVGTTTIGRNYSPVLQQLKVALSDAEAKVASMKARVDEYASRVARLRAMSSAVPEMEAQYSQLNRDYQINKTNYEKLIQSRDAAKLSGDLSSTTEMMTFRIIDPPTVPSKPAGPNRPRLFSIVIAGGLIAALLIAFVLSQVRPTVASIAQLREITGLPVLGSVSMNWTQIEKKRRRKKLYAFSAGLASMLLVSGGALGILFLKS
ncbi:MAG: chain length-determining protein [Herminiimonas sp.]|nr:chain length-determining protein [Herminiimonas sp.]